MQYLLMFCVGMVAGSGLAFVLIALLSANKRDDLEHEKLMCYKEGYEKGFVEGCEVRSQHKGG